MENMKEVINSISKKNLVAIVDGLLDEMCIRSVDMYEGFDINVWKGELLTKLIKEHGTSEKGKKAVITTTNLDSILSVEGKDFSFSGKGSIQFMRNLLEEQGYRVKTK